MYRYSTAFAVLILIFSPSWGQQPDTAAHTSSVRAAFDSIVTANTYHLRIEEDTLRGRGVDWLVEQGKDAHHFMIGERHGTAEIPIVAGAVYERLKTVGYEYAALEIGPFAARHVNDVLDRGRFDALEGFLTSYDAPPIAFFDAREEARLAARIHRVGGTIWGLDQEFATSLPMHLDALEKQAVTERESTAVRNLRSQMVAEWAEGHDYLGNADPAALRTLRRAFEPRGDDDALARIDAIIVSNQIYAPYLRDTGSFYHSGIQRENYMKRTLVDHLRQAEAENGRAPRVFYKFGGLHSGRHPGTNLDPRVPLGTFVSEWARTIRGEKTFHLFVDCNGGTNEESGQGGGGTCAPALTAEARAQGTTSPYAKHLSDEGLTLIDLTALRDRFSDWDVLTERARMFIFAVDAYMTVSDVSPSTLLERAGAGEGTSE